MSQASGRSDGVFKGIPSSKAVILHYLSLCEVCANLYPLPLLRVTETLPGQGELLQPTGAHRENKETLQLQGASEAAALWSSYHEVASLGLWATSQPPSLQAWTLTSRKLGGCTCGRAIAVSQGESKNVVVLGKH